MPCYDSRDTHSYGVQETRAELQPRIDMLARIACEALTILELNPDIIKHMSKETRDWWEEHKKFDAERKARGES